MKITILKQLKRTFITIIIITIFPINSNAVLMNGCENAVELRLKKQTNNSIKKYRKFKTFVSKFEYNTWYGKKILGTAAHLGNGWFLTASHIVNYFNHDWDGYQINSNRYREIEKYLKNNSANKQLFKFSSNQDFSILLKDYIKINKSYQKKLTNITFHFSFPTSSKKNNTITFSKAKIYVPTPTHFLKEADNILLLPDIALIKIESSDIIEDYNSPKLFNEINSVKLLFKSIAKKEWAEAFPIEGIITFCTQTIFKKGLFAYTYGTPVFKKLHMCLESNNALFPKLTGINKIPLGTITNLGQSGTPVLTKHQGNVGIVGVSTGSNRLIFLNKQTTILNGKSESTTEGLYSMLTFINYPPTKKWAKSLLPKDSWIEK